MTAMMLTIILAVLAAAFQAPAPVFTGRWSGDEDGQSLVLDLTHDVQSGRVTGTMTMLGATVPVEGRVRGGEQRHECAVEDLLQFAAWYGMTKHVLRELQSFQCLRRDRELDSASGNLSSPFCNFVRKNASRC
jgi:hypothetical protein